MKMLIRTLTTVINVPDTGLIANMIKMMHANDMAMAWPAIMLANNRIINAKGFVMIPKNSIKGIKGIGAFIHKGTSGQKISFQYAFVPVKFVTKKVHRAKKKVQVMFPVRLPPPGGKGMTPMKLEMRMKKKQVNRYGAYLSASSPSVGLITSS